MHRKVFGKALFSLSSLFVLGDAIIVFPQKSGADYTIFSFITASLLGLFLYFLISFICGKLAVGHNEKTFKKALENSILIIVSVFSAFVGADTFIIFARFISDVILKTTPIYIITVVLLGVVIYFAFKKQESILKFSLISFIAVLILIIFFFFASFSDYEIKNLALKQSIELNTFYKSLKTFIKNPILSCLLLPFYYRFALKEKNATAHSGVVAGYILLGICIMSSVLLFGSGLSATLSYPYFSAVSTITVGRLYTRLDGFLYFVYFVTSIIKITVCIFISRSCLKLIRNAKI